MKQKYEIPDMEVFLFGKQDLICTSGGEDDETERLPMSF